MVKLINRIHRKLIYEGIVQPKTNKGRKAIITYHGVDMHENLSFNTRFFSAASFEKQVAYYKKNYNVLNLEDFFEDKNRVVDKLNVALTFDDGYQNNLKYALPILEKYKMPATFFITGLNTIQEEILWADLLDLCTPHIHAAQLKYNGETFHKDAKGRFSTLKEYIKTHEVAGTTLFTDLKQILLQLSGVDLSDPALFDYWKLLTDDEIRTVAKSHYVKIGSHGMYHTNLGNIPLQKASDEVLKSKHYLENLAQYEIASIGYPDGSYSLPLADYAATVGYKYQCACRYLFSEDTINKRIYLHDRVDVYPISSVHYINDQVNTLSV